MQNARRNMISMLTINPDPVFIEVNLITGTITSAGDFVPNHYKDPHYKLYNTTRIYRLVPQDQFLEIEISDDMKLGKIGNQVCAKHNITAKELQSSHTSNALRTARREFILRCFYETEFKGPKIGRLINRSRKTVDDIRDRFFPEYKRARDMENMTLERVKDTLSTHVERRDTLTALIANANRVTPQSEDYVRAETFYQWVGEVAALHVVIENLKQVIKASENHA